jgi:hypothetical protein
VTQHVVTQRNEKLNGKNHLSRGMDIDTILFRIDSACGGAEATTLR